MTLFILFAILVLSAIFCLSINPEPVIRQIGKWKRAWRQHIARKYGEIQAQSLVIRFRREAQQEGIEPIIIEQVIAERYPDAVKQLGDKTADQLLDPPTFLEHTW